MLLISYGQKNVTLYEILLVNYGSLHYRQTLAFCMPIFETHLLKDLIDVSPLIAEQMLVLSMGYNE